MRIDGSQPRTVAPRPYQPADIAWSPDGRRLAYITALSDPPYDQVLHIVDLGTGRVRRAPTASTELCEGGHAKGGSPSRKSPSLGRFRSWLPIGTASSSRARGSVRGWSPDGTKLAVFRSQMILVFDGRGRRVASFRGQRPMSWAPDSRRIAYVHGAPWHSGLRPSAIRMHGGSRRCAPLQAATLPLWSPDGRQLVYEAEISQKPFRGGAFVISVDGGRPRLVPNGSGVFAWASNRRLVVWRWAEQQELAVIPIAGGRATVLARFPARLQISRQLSPDRRIVVIHNAYR